MHASFFQSDCFVFFVVGLLLAPNEHAAEKSLGLTHLTNSYSSDRNALVLSSTLVHTTTTLKVPPPRPPSLSEGPQHGVHRGLWAVSDPLF